MGRRRFIESEQDKLDRIQRLTSAIAEIESYLQFFDDKGEQADVGCWGVRYQVRQKDKISVDRKLTCLGCACAGSGEKGRVF